MKRIFFVVCIFLLSGCAASYNLEIGNDSFKEKITVDIDKYEIPTSREDGIEVDDQITPFLNNDYEALSKNFESKYKKTVTDNGDYYSVLMNYKYSEKEFGKANSLKRCFENYEFGYDKRYYLHVYGDFYCLYSNEMTINIKTNNKVLKNNADIVNGNVYTWIINSENSNNVDIEFEVEKGFPTGILMYIIYGVSLVIILVLIYSLIISKRRKINEI